MFHVLSSDKMSVRIFLLLFIGAGSCQNITSEGARAMCADVENTPCKEWKETGQCQLNPSAVLFDCPRSCGLCDQLHDPVCPVRLNWEDLVLWSSCYVRTSSDQKLYFGSPTSSSCKSAECLHKPKTSQDCWLQEQQGDCLYGDWGAWSDCSVSCGEGVRTRSRSLGRPNHCRQLCDKTRETQECESHQCPREEKECSDSEVVLCKSLGEEGACRTNATYMLRHCPDTCGLCQQLQSNNSCQVDCGHSDLGKWDVCSVSCREKQLWYNTGRSMSVGGSCWLLTSKPDDCLVSPWTAWTNCTNTTATRKRFREVVNVSACGEKCSHSRREEESCSKAVIREVIHATGSFGTWKVLTILFGGLLSLVLLIIASVLIHKRRKSQGHKSDEVRVDRNHLPVAEAGVKEENNGISYLEPSRQSSHAYCEITSTPASYVNVNVTHVSNPFYR